MPRATVLRPSVRAILANLACPRCGKSMVVRNLGGYRQAPHVEAVTRATHCTCLGGPAAHLPETDLPGGPR